MAKKKVAVLISGKGGNLQALIDACAHPDYPAQIVLVISNNKDAYGLVRASKAGIATCVVNHRDYDSREAFDQAMGKALDAAQVEFVCLAGFMRLLSAGFVEYWHDRLINVHPSLLPDFKGANAIADALEAGVEQTGCTVHFVRAEMDTGPVILQAPVAVEPDDDEESLRVKLHEQEHRCYVQALEWLASGQLVVQGDQVRKA